MNKISRRETLKILASAPLAAGFSWTGAEVQEAQEKVLEARRTGAEDGKVTPRFFTDHEYKTVQALVDLIIPADERSGSATDVGVHEFIDFMMVDQPSRQTTMRGGLAWIDVQCQKRFGKTFVDCSGEKQKAMLDEIAWPRTAKPEMTHGVAFFNSFRDLTATGFWTSKMGIEDLQYMGNRFVPQWAGCPKEALDQLGVKYHE
ncbi:gluconate 2-dehydrogenase subunit 3 family protein [Acidobacteria bacterium AH-259-O06]|nr:gluconate 2-dehydrogenase subunit 3 family protein [Acidobacteria bacterium AH-259-O06]